MAGATPTTLGEWLDPANSALLVYDMQVGITRQVAGAETVVRQVEKVIGAARARGVRIAFCRHHSLPKAWMGAFATRMAMAWQRTEDPEAIEPWFPRDCEAIQIVPELSPRPEDFVFDKLTMSAFEGTPLQLALRDAGLRAVVICGIATEIGIEPTCRHAADLGIVPIVIADACGAGDPAAGERAIATLRFAGDAIVTDVAAFLDALG